MSNLVSYIKGRTLIENVKEQSGNLHQTIGVIKSMRMILMGLGGWLVEVRNVNKILVRKPEGKRGLASHRWDDNSRMDHKSDNWWTTGRFF